MSLKLTLMKLSKKSLPPFKTERTRSHSERKAKNLILLIILLFGFLLRFSYLCEFRQTPFFNAQLLSDLDQRTWDEIGTKVLNHPWFVDGNPFYQAPGYAYFLAAVYRIFGVHNYLSVGIIQILLDLLAAFLIFLLGKRLWNDWTGLIACALYAFYRPFIYYSATLLSDSFILFTNVLCLFLVYWTLECPERKNRWMLAGLGLGLAAITKPTVLFFLFLSFLIVVANLRKQGRQFRRSFLLGSLLFLIGFFLLVAPISIRNSLLAGKFVTVATYGNVNWQIGNSADSIGLFVYPKGPLLSPASLDFWKLWGKKTFLFFSSYEWPQNLNIYLMTAITNTLKLPLFAFGLVVPLGLVGFFTASKSKFRHLQVYTFANVFSIVAFFITSRYRLPAVAGFILLASGYLFFLFEKTLLLLSHQNRSALKSRPANLSAPKLQRLKLDAGEGGISSKINTVHPTRDLILVFSSLLALAILSFVLVNSWSGQRIGEVHVRYYAVATEKSVAYDQTHAQPVLAQKKIDTFNQFIFRYQSGQIY